MPRTIHERTAHANDLAARLEAGQLQVLSGPHDATELRHLAQAVVDAGRAEAAVTDAVTAARAAGHPWRAIAHMLGTTTQAAQQRYRDIT